MCIGRPARHARGSGARSVRRGPSSVSSSIAPGRSIDGWWEPAARSSADAPACCLLCEHSRLRLRFTRMCLEQTGWDERACFARRARIRRLVRPLGLVRPLERIWGSWPSTPAHRRQLTRGSLRGESVLAGSLEIFVAPSRPWSRPPCLKGLPQRGKESWCIHTNGTGGLRPHPGAPLP